MAITSGALPATVDHELHPEHKLSLVNLPSSGFNCDVCKQHGQGKEHYRCEPCDFDAHAECATAPATFKHVNYAEEFVLHAAPDSGHPPMYCGLCGCEVLGYSYYNGEEEDRLHPCCAFLPRRVVQDGRTFQLGYHPSRTCGVCKSMSTSSLSYRSNYDGGEEVYLHVPCLVDINNMLTGNQDWVASAPIRPGVLGWLTRKKEAGDPHTPGIPGTTVRHELHPEHKLSLVNIHHFDCDVCKQYGKGKAHYRCEPCDFDAHADCATAPATFKHINYAGNFVLYTRYGSGEPQRYCGLCGLEVLGYGYYNREEECCVHPCCAFLPSRVIQDGHEFQLDYYPSGMCGICRKVSMETLSYYSSYDDGEEVYLHVPCLVDTNNRLTGYQDWVASAPIRPGVLGSLTRQKERGDPHTPGTSGETVSHELHPEHKLRLVNIHGFHFQCDVCKQYGKGTAHYQCEPCNFTVHVECATAPATFKHVNYPGDFVLHTGSGWGDPQRYCGLCAHEVHGYRYYNRGHDCHLHPCCAFLPRRVIQDGRAFDLGYHPSSMCGMCHEKSTASLSYRSSYDDGKEVYLHVWCLVHTHNRLTGYQDWVASAPIWPGVLGSFTRKKGSDFMKAASVSFKIARAVLELASLDLGGAAETVQNVAEAFSSE